MTDEKVGAPLTFAKDAPTDLYTENQRLKRQLRAYLSKARQNEEKFLRLQTLELQLISCTSLKDLIHTVTHDYRLASNLEKATLVLYDPEYELRRILEEDGVDHERHHDLLFTENLNDLKALFGDARRPYLGSYNSLVHGHMFKIDDNGLESIAVLPLAIRGRLIGSLNLGSYHLGRFVQGTASDFLERLANIVAVCLLNVKNHEQLKKIGLTDVLTGLNNRRFFDQRLLEEVASVQRNQAPLSCLFFDIDFFKKVNDVYGHQAGDIVLREVAAIIRQNLRATDVIARFGGEEFAALLPHTDANIGMEIADRIRASIANRQFDIGENEWLELTISIGMSTLKDADIGTAPKYLGEKLIQRADENLYKAKSSGRNRVIGDIPNPQLDFDGL
ncbi:MAG: DUF484 family protein [Gammaproteobacteria bacterium]|nr:DUF484 family protein [Gammaproteobacteria bacterium]